MITRTLIAEKDRYKFLPCHCGKWHYMMFETAVYAAARRLCPDYTGGYWDFYDLSNGGWYMSLDSEKPCRVVWELNGFEGTMTPDAFGITSCLYAYNAMFGSRDELFVPAYHALRDYALEHAESELILAAID